VKVQKPYYVTDSNSYYPECGEVVEDADVSIYFDPNLPNTIPCITGIQAFTPSSTVGNPAVFYGDVLKDLAAPISSFGVTFNQNMRASGASPSAVVGLETWQFAGTITSVKGETHDFTGQSDVETSYTVTWNATGFTIAPTLMTAAQMATDLSVVWTTAGDSASTISYTTGAYKIQFYPMNPFMASALLIPWAPASFDDFDLSTDPAGCVDLQNFYLLAKEGSGSDLTSIWECWVGFGKAVTWINFESGS